MTFLHPEDNPGNLKATMVFDMNSAGLKHTLSVLPQITNTICPQVVSDSAPTSMEQMGPNRNILHFPVTDTRNNLYEYQSNLYTYPLGIRFTVSVVNTAIGYNNQSLDDKDNFKITLSSSEAPLPKSLAELVRNTAFTGSDGRQGMWTYDMDFRLMQSTVGPAVVNYLASLINGILANAASEADMRKIPGFLEILKQGNQIW